MGNNLKTNIPAVATMGLAAGSVALAHKYQPVADGFSKIADKGINALKKNGVWDKAKDAGKKIFDYAKKNPKVAKTAALVSAVAVPVISLLSIKNIHQNGKIEGKYQAVVDAKKQH